MGGRHEAGVTATTDYVPVVEAGGLRAEEVRMDLMQHYREDVLHSAGMPEELPGQLGMVGGVARLLAPEVASRCGDWRAATTASSRPP